MSAPANIPTAAPTKRVTDIRSLSYALAGPELPYPVYQFSGGRFRYEFPTQPGQTDPV